MLRSQGEVGGRIGEGEGKEIKGAKGEVGDRMGRGGGNSGKGEYDGWVVAG